MARLPVPYQDLEWGPILNQYLLQAHADDGTLRAGTVGTKQVQDGSITAAKLADDIKAVMPRIFVGKKPPANPQDGDIWFDVSGSKE